MKPSPIDGMGAEKGRAEFDHVIFATNDATDAGDRLRRDYGLGSIKGASHPWGTANVIVPLEPPTYLELLFVEDRDTLASDAEGARLLARLRDGDHWNGWALRSPDVPSLARSFGFTVDRGQATRADGSVAGYTVAYAENDESGAVPFFIAYDNPAQRLERWTRDRGAAQHAGIVGPVAWIEVAASPAGRAILERIEADVEVRVLTDEPYGVRGMGTTIDSEVVEIR